MCDVAMQTLPYNNTSLLVGVKVLHSSKFIILILGFGPVLLLF